MIVLWGARCTGKTVFLTAFYHALLMGDKGWRIMPSDLHSAKFISRMNEDLIAHHVFPPATCPEDCERVFRFDIAIPKMFGYKQSSLYFLDPAGEFFENPELNEAYNNFIFERIKISRGLICFIDIARDKRSKYFELLLKNFTLIKNTFFPNEGVKQIPIPLAFCLSKMDQYKEFRKNYKTFDAEKFAVFRMGKATINIVKTYFKTYKFFGISSLGFDINGNPNIFIDKDGFPRPLKLPNPINVIEVVEWILKEWRLLKKQWKIMIYNKFV